jgi:hypothetical protein
VNEFDNLEIDWTKSYVSTPVAFGFGVNTAFVFGISYYQCAPGTMNRIKNALSVPQNEDIPPGTPLPIFQPGSFQ